MPSTGGKMNAQTQSQFSKNTETDFTGGDTNRNIRTNVGTEKLLALISENEANKIF